MVVSHLFEHFEKSVHVRGFDEVLIPRAVRDIIGALFNHRETLGEEIDFAFIIVYQEGDDIVSTDQAQELRPFVSR
jgi:hypothetical protein